MSLSSNQSKDAYRLKTLIMRHICLVAFLLIWSSFSIAQNYVDLAKFDYAISPANTFDSTTSKTTLHEANLDLTAPIVINDRFTFLTGVSYDNISASFNPNRSDESFTGLILKLGANIKHNSKWSGTYMLLPKISSDFKSISKKDFQIGGVVLMKYIKSEHLNYKFGVYGNNELFGPFIVPIFGFYHLSSSEKFEAKILLPLSVDLNYSVKKDVRFGLSFKGQVRSYHVNQPLGTEADRHLVKSTNDIYSYFQYGTKKGLNFQLGFGRSIGRTYRMYDDKVSLALPLFNFGDNRTQLNSDFSDNWLIKVGVFYRLELD